MSSLLNVLKLRYLSDGERFWGWEGSTFMGIRVLFGDYGFIMVLISDFMHEFLNPSIKLKLLLLL